jgi:hypothetical protein
MKGEAMLGKRVRAVRLALLAAGLLWPLVAQTGCKEEGRARKGAWISGTVVGANGAPVPHAVVLVDGVGVHVTCDAKGRYSVGPLPAGMYTLVAGYPGLTRGTRFNLDLAQDQRLAGIDFSLDTDPNYVADSVKIEKVKPAPGSILKSGTTVQLELSARCVLRNCSYAKIRFTVQDENENPLVRDPPGHIITRSTPLVPFVQKIEIPDRVSGKLFVAVVLLPGNDARYSVVDYISYDIRKYEDHVTLSRVELKSVDEKDPTKVVLVGDVAYKLDYLEEAQLRVTVQAAYPDRQELDLLRTETHTLRKATLASGTHLLSVPLLLAPTTGSVLVRVELLTLGKGDVVDHVVHKPIPVPWDVSTPLQVLGAEEKEQKQ